MGVWYPNNDADIVVRLRAVLNPPRTWIDDAADEITSLRAALDRSEAARERLREALSDLVQVAFDCIQDGSNENRKRLVDSWDWARGVLVDLDPAADAPAAGEGA